MTNAELAILGLILEKPRHGYEIEAVIEERDMRDWTEIGFSSIYYILKKLEKTGLIESQTERGPGRGPARRVYRITREGVAAWREATREALTGPHNLPSPFLLGMVGLPGLPPEEAIAALREYQQHILQRRGRLQTRWKAAGERLPLFLDGMFDYGVRLVDAELEWLEEFIRKLAADAAKKENHDDQD